jgi:hypothetical protein
VITPVYSAKAISPSGWFWIVGNHPGEVYSSAAAAYMPDTDSRYTDWVTAGNLATAIIVCGELAHVLANYGLTGPAVLNVQPTVWGSCTANDITLAMQAAGVKITSTATPTLDGHYQLGGPFDGMMRTQVYVNAANQLPNNTPIVWPCYDAPVTINTAIEFTALYQGLQDYYNAWQTWAGNTAAGPQPTWGTKSIA